MCGTTEVTQILSRFEAGDPAATNELLPLVYEELRRLARVQLAGEKPGNTLQATALVHEAYLRLARGAATDHWQSRGQFFRAAAECMRRILIDAARRKQTVKRGGDLRRIELAESMLPVHHSPDDLLALDEALANLLADDPLAGEVAKLRLFAGLTVEEAADELGMSRRSGFRSWTYARAFLQLRLESRDQSSWKGQNSRNSWH